ncbi:DEKNAAC100514 [Brettanomyces naardenensis]|uniref:DEKNAAC100514 n=1 Tax=Brettanomyces naardenensis TaxID=13370 RepID=A0A448YEU4_BRENA|nr:DEKNAAC100514 [Brettanomyces naardenensis]
MTWEELVDDEGRVYYYNSKTEETQWGRPEDFTSEDSKIDKLLAKGQWSRFVTDEGEVYYFNEKTEESVWELPEEVQRKLKEGNDEVTTREGEGKEEDTKEVENIEPSKESDDHTAVNWEESENTEGSKRKVKKSQANDIVGLKELLRGSDEGERSMIRVDDDRMKDVEDHEGIRDEEDYSKQDFIEMLKEKGVDSSWSFTKVMESCIEDPRYWRIEDPLMRKQMHEIYLIGKADEEFKKVENSKEAYRNTFTEVLKKHDVKYYTQWKTCVREIIDESIFSLIPTSLKREFFDEYVGRLRLEHDSEQKKIREQQLDKLTEQLTPAIKYDSSFEKLLESVDLEKKYPALSKLDVLTLYENVIKDREAEFEDRLRENEKLNYRMDRRARDQFRSLLEELPKKKGIKYSATLKWSELLTYIRDEEAFIELCGHQGSSAIDFYWDIIDRENQLIRTKKDLCRQVLSANKLDIGGFDDDVDRFKEKMKEVGGSNGTITDEFSDEDYKLVFELLKEDEKPTATKRKHETEETSGSPDQKKSRLATMGYGAIR